jgi:hypothetical protein
VTTTGQCNRALLLVALLVTGCATAEPTLLHPHARWNPQLAYLYGRFMVDGDTSLNLVSGPEVTFEIRCRDGKTYEIRFTRDHSVQVIALRPAICQIEDIVSDDGGSHGHVAVGAAAAGIAGAVIVYAIEGDQTPRQMSGFRLLENEELRPGGVYYVGDFTLTAKDNRNANDRHYDWTYKIRDDYVTTTKEMKRTYARFAPDTTEDRTSR